MPLPHVFTDSQSRPVVIGTQLGVPNSAGGSAGAAVTVAVSFVDQFNNGLLPTNYTAHVTPSQTCFGDHSPVLTPASTWC